ncbi:hypothetical protein V2G26_005030 [Clonostachys chloroleuca]
MTTTPIPGPKGLPIIGNLLELQDEVPIHALERLGDVYKDIFKLKIAGHDNYFVCSHELFNELCDETRFFKFAPPALVADEPEGRARGLFSSNTEKEQDWAQAHRILIPAFGPMAILDMYNEMYDIATQLIMKWARKGPETPILATDDFTRLTLDTIALCAMDYRFNSFYSDVAHPYVKAMGQNLTSRSERGQIGNIFKRMLPGYQAEIQKNFDYMHSIADDIIQYRRQNPTDKKDLLNAMINGKDPKTGEGMRDELIAANMQTFLIAGHETTSGLLSFAFMNMLLKPETYFAAREEVDRVIGKENVQAKHLKELHYIEAVLREALRLSPTAPAFARGVRPENTEETVTIGKARYEIPRGQPVLCLLGKIQRDPAVFGDDADEFKPERMLDGKFEDLPKNAWKPFGTGLRGCIGRAFAWQEALMVTAMVLQNFDISLDDPNYKIRIQQSLTIKPADCYIRARLRSGISAVTLQSRLSGSQKQHSEEPASATSNVDQEKGQPFLILFGSNTGSCQALAQKLASQAAEQGYNATVTDMDNGVQQLPVDGTPTIVITASYEGQPTDNATRFIAWLQSLQGGDKLKGSRFAVFGCGHKDWSATYQRIPKLVDNLIEANGGLRLADRGVSDASQGDISGDFENWTTEKLWPMLLSDLHAGRSLEKMKPKMPKVEISISHEQRAENLQAKAEWAEVTYVKSLTQPGESEKRHIEFKLRESLPYQAGDYLTVLPLNPDVTIKRVMRRFNLPADGVVKITKQGSTMLPTDQPISISDLLAGYVELSQPATKRDLELLVDTVPEGDEKSNVISLAEEPNFTFYIKKQRISLLDVLESNAISSTIGFASFLALLPPLKARYYSISSSSLADPSICSLTYSVLDAPAWADGKKHFIGVAGNYLKSLTPGDKALVSIRASSPKFKMPKAPEATPIIMLCSGTGLAPFRAFMQERAILIREGRRTLAPALLLVGCRTAESDRLYAEEMDEWNRLGVADVRYAFSREPNHQLANGCSRVQDRLVQSGEDVVRLFQAGAKVYTCGSSALLQGMKEAATAVIVQARQKKGLSASEEDLENWFRQHHDDRLVSDVFS